MAQPQEMTPMPLAPKSPSSDIHQIVKSPLNPTDGPLQKSMKQEDLSLYETKQRPEPEEEFFMMSVMALKMIHTEKYRDVDYVYEISAQKLYRHVKGLSLPFHLWYSWLEKRFQDLHEMHAYEAMKKAEELKQWQLQREQEKESSKKEEA